MIVGVLTGPFSALAAAVLYFELRRSATAGVAAGEAVAPDATPAAPDAAPDAFGNAPSAPAADEPSPPA